MAPPLIQRRDASARALLGDAIVARRHDVAAEIDGVRTAASAESVHRMRVATRRLRVALQEAATAFGRQRTCTWTKALRRVTCSLGPARDADVQVALLRVAEDTVVRGSRRKGLRDVRRWIATERDGMQPRLVARMDALEASGLLEEIERRASILAVPRVARSSVGSRAVAGARIAARLDVVRADASIVPDPDAVAALHALRIKVKKLRYAMELFRPAFTDDDLRPFIRDVRRLQTALGDVHDADVWLADGPRLGRQVAAAVAAGPDGDRRASRVAAAMARFLEDRLRTRGRAHDDVIVRWRALDDGGRFDALAGLAQRAIDDVASTGLGCEFDDGGGDGGDEGRDDEGRDDGGRVTPDDASGAGAGAVASGRGPRRPGDGARPGPVDRMPPA